MLQRGKELAEVAPTLPPVMGKALKVSLVEDGSLIQPTGPVSWLFFRAGGRSRSWPRP